MFITIDQADFQQVVETWNQGFSDYLLPIHVDQATLEHRIQSLSLSKNLSAVFSIDGEFAGIILLGIQTFQQTKVMWVGGMAVIPKYRRNKVASKLIDYAERLARENQCDHLILEVIATNERARKLYEAKGLSVVNELAVGSVDLLVPAKAASTIYFQPITSKEQAMTEKQWTPWQNRSIFLDQNYAIYQNESRIGSISFNLAEEASGKGVTLKQVQLFKEQHLPLMMDILLTLKEQENSVTVKLNNFDMATPEYRELQKIGVTLQLTQFQLAKQLNRNNG
ncbi:hypothetical protein ATZ33_15655 [Enterococcus silesiacus]|nr:GNAT family N-acetyltransferase [Enterococcus silesiacus]ALS02761.1 hypothetical protein ATZ33_15655 [Enterococcus silesiacus]